MTISFEILNSFLRQQNNLDCALNDGNILLLKKNLLLFEKFISVSL